MRVGWKVVSSGFHELNATLVHSHAHNVPPGHPKRLEHFCGIVQSVQVLWWETTREHHKARQASRRQAQGKLVWRDSQACRQGEDR